MKNVNKPVKIGHWRSGRRCELPVDKFAQTALENLGRFAQAEALMKSPSRESRTNAFWRNPQALFRLHFQRRLAEFSTFHGSAAEGFGIVWEETLEKVPLEESVQGRVYRELIAWARCDKLFTDPKEPELLQAWREMACDF